MVSLLTLVLSIFEEIERILKLNVNIFICLMVVALGPALGCAKQEESTVQYTIDQNNESVALELAEWGMPVVSFFAQKEASLRDVGAQPNQILFWSKPFDYNNKILTPNDVTLYISAQIETFDGPMVFEVPAARGQLGIFGSLIDPFMVPLEDIGGANGVDKGLGGKILITPPEYKKSIPDGFLHVPTSHYNTVAGLRITPVSFDAEDIEQAVRYIKMLKLYPLGSDEEKTVFVDGENKPYDPRPPYDANYFRLLNSYIQAEAHKSIDAPFIAKMEQIGIVKGEEFRADDSYAQIAAQLKDNLQAGFRNVGDPFFPSAHWTTPVSPSEPATQFTYVGEDGSYDWKTRAQTFHWAIWAPKHLGSETFYLIGQRDSEGNVLESAETYELLVPAKVPAKQFWSVTIYEFETGGTFFDDVPKVAVSSKNEDLVYNEDGSVTLTIGPALLQERPSANFLPTAGNGHWFALFRWYGPLPELMPNSGDKRWLMGDFKKLPVQVK